MSQENTSTQVEENELFTERDTDVLNPESPISAIKYLAALPTGITIAWTLMTAVVAVLLVGSNIGASMIWGRVIDVVRGVEIPLIGSGQQAFWAILAAGLVLMLVENTARPFLAYLLTKRFRQLSVDLRRQCVHATLSSPVPQLMQIGTGNVITRLTRDIDRFVTMVQTQGTRALITLVMLPLSMIALAMISWHYLLVVILIVAVSWPTLGFALHHMPAAANRLSVADARRNDMLLDTVRGVATIRALGLHDWALNRVEKNSWMAVRASLRRVPVENRLNLASFVLFGMLQIAAIGIGAWGVLDGSLTIGQATGAVIIVVRLEMPIFNLMMFAGEIQESITALGRAVALAKLAEPLKESPLAAAERGQDSADESATDASPHRDYVDANGKALPARISTTSDVEVSNLTVRYPSGPPVIENLSLRLQGGTTTALVGTSGAGKSTLAQAIAGLILPDSGTVRIGGIDTSTAPDNWVAAQVLMISQEVHLFSGTLRDDLLMARAHASDEELFTALSEVGLAPDSAEWTRWLPEGLDTLVGAGHNDMDPVVAQQITLARTLLADPPIIIMDEATSEAGSQQGEALENAAATVAKTRTALVVAHRLNQAETADRILLMEEGRIVEDGSHEELMAAGGNYAALYNRWAGHQSR